MSGGLGELVIPVSTFSLIRRTADDHTRMLLIGKISSRSTLKSSAEKSRGSDKNLLRLAVVLKFLNLQQLKLIENGLRDRTRRRSTVSRQRSTSPVCVVTSQTEPLTFSSTRIRQNSQDAAGHTYENVNPQGLKTRRSSLKDLPQDLENCIISQKQNSQEGSSKYDVPHSPPVPVGLSKDISKYDAPQSPPVPVGISKDRKDVVGSNKIIIKCEITLGGPDKDVRESSRHKNIPRQIEQRQEITEPVYVNAPSQSFNNSSDNNAKAPQTPEIRGDKKRETDSGYLTMSPAEIVFPAQCLAMEDKEDDPLDEYKVPSQLHMSLTGCEEVIEKMVQEETQYLRDLEDLASVLGTPATLDLTLLDSVLTLYDFHRLIFKPELEKAQTSQQLSEVFTRNRDKFNGYKKLLVKRSKSLSLKHTTEVTEKVLLTMKHLQRYKINLTQLMKQEDPNSSLKSALDTIHFCLNSANTHLLLDSIVGCPLLPDQYRPALRKGLIRLKGDGTSLIDKEVFAILTETYLVFAKSGVDTWQQRPYVGSIRMESVSRPIGDSKSNSLTFDGILQTDGRELSKRTFCITASNLEEARAWMKAIRGILDRQAEAMKALRPIS